MKDIRASARAAKDFVLSDTIRDELDGRNVFVFDEVDGFQTTWHLNDDWFRYMNQDGFPQFTTKRQYVEYRMRQDRQAEALCDAQEATRLAKMRKRAKARGVPLLLADGTPYPD